jgi:hypothetical protein
MSSKKHTSLLIEPRCFETTTVSIITDFYTKLGTDDWIFVFYCGKDLKSFWEEKLESIEIEIRELPVHNFDSSAEYSTFCKQKSLWTSLYGTFVLVFQLDTFIKNTAPYDIHYFMNLNHSFIGGNMIYSWTELPSLDLLPCKNFNGGLSLRKREDMIRIIDTIGTHEFAEDVYFTYGCLTLGLSMGDDEPSSHFALHTIYKEDFFGGHNISVQIYDILQSEHGNPLEILEDDKKDRFFYIWKGNQEKNGSFSMST